MSEMESTKPNPIDELDYLHNDEVVCPYCDYEHSDSWDFGLKDGNESEIECGDCEKTFTVISELEVHYSTWRKRND